MYFHEPKASENTAHECNILPYYTLPWKDEFITYGFYLLKGEATIQKKGKKFNLMLAGSHLNQIAKVCLHWED